MLRKSYVFVIIALLFTSCTKQPNAKTTKNTHKVDKELNHNQDEISYKENELITPNTKNKKAETIISSDEYKKMFLKESSNKEISEALMDFYEEWKDVKYKFGGSSKTGIDCSSFTQRFFKDKFNITIPRSTKNQVNWGVGIDRNKLKLGDLVFFKTGKIDRHVGIYMGNGDFLHASIKGIQFTKLDKPFYKKTYWTSRRVIE